MLRLVLEADFLSEFPVDGIGGYIKFAFDRSGQPVSSADTPDSIKLRTYTIRALDAASGQLTVDCVLHGDDPGHDGPASAFARTAQVGDRIAIAGPGGVKSLAPDADWYLMAGDMTALPAIAAKLELLSASKTHILGHLVVELSDPGDAHYLSVPQGLELHTFINPDPAENTSGLIETVRALPWRDGKVFAWCACEFGRMRAFRDYARSERLIGLDDRYVSSYWMLGHTEEGHKAEKKRDPGRD